MAPGIRYMLTSVVVFSMMGVLVKLVAARIPTQEIVLARSLVTLVLSAILLRRASVPFRGNNHKLLVLRGLFGFGALSCFFYSLVHLPLGDAMVIHYIAPIITAMLAGVLLGEAFPRTLVISTVLCLAGVVAVARPLSLLSGAPDLDPVVVGVAALGACFSAGAYVVIRRLGTSEHPLVVVFYFPLVAVPATLPAVIHDFVMPQGIEWLVLLGIGVTTQIAQVYMTRGLQLEPAGRAMSVTYLQVVLSMLWGLVFFGEVPVRWTLIGAGLVLGGTAIAALSQSRRAPR